MNEHHYAVIMAGGGGTRLWPLSRKEHPKQQVPLIENKSLFQIAVDRLAGVFPPERILVVTIAEQASALREICPQIPVENYILEPEPRGTASVVGLAAVALQQRDAQAVMAVLTADHLMQDEQRFCELLRLALRVAEAGNLVTLGIQPTFPATGYGYIQCGAVLDGDFGVDVHHVQRFKEKPLLQQAETMLEEGGHYWNSGMFFWQVTQILNEIERQMPDLFTALVKIKTAWNTPRREQVLTAAWAGLHPQTIDYGVMEGAENAVVVPAAGLGWKDVGSWDALYALYSPDEAGNIVAQGQYVNIASRNNMVYSSDPQRLVVAVGVDDLIIVDTGDVLMICRKNHAQDVRQVVRKIKQDFPRFL